MRHLFYISIFVSVYIIAACSGHSFRRSLLVADSMSSVDPKSAVSLLDSIRGEMSSAPKHERMYYRLLCIKAADKAYIQHKSDTAILPLIEYYEKHGDKKLLAETYYYAGSIYRDMNDAPMALDYFQKALDVMPEDADLGLKSNICYQMGDLFLHQYFYDEAIESYKKAYYSDSILKNINQIIDCYRIIAIVYTCKNQRDSSYYYYKKAYNLAKNNRNHEMEVKLLGQMTDFYIADKDYIKANECLQPVLHADSNNISSHYSMASDIYMGLGEFDSAYYYCKELLDVGTVYAKQDASKKLVKISLKKGHYDEMNHYMDLYELYTDSILKITATETVAQMNAMYNYQIREKENMQLKIERSRHNVIFIFILLSTCGVIIFLIIYSSKLKQKRLRLELQVSTLEKVKKDMFERSQKFIDSNNKKIADLELQLRVACHKTEELTNTLIQQKKDLIFANEKAERNIIIRNVIAEKLLASDAYSIVKKKLEQKKIITKVEWDEIEDTINRIVDDFKVHLYGVINLSEHEYRICLLIRLGCSISEISNLLSRSYSAISLAKKRLYFKIFKKDGLGSDLDEFIKSL